MQTRMMWNLHGRISSEGSQNYVDIKCLRVCVSQWENPSVVYSQKKLENVNIFTYKKKR